MSRRDDFQRRRGHLAGRRTNGPAYGRSARCTGDRQRRELFRHGERVLRRIVGDDARPRFASIQAYYSLVGRDLEREIVPLALDQSLGILPWSPLAGGALTGKYSADGAAPKDGRRTRFDFPPVDWNRLEPLLEVMRVVAANHDVSIARVALAWLLSQAPVTSIIIGARTLEQLADNLAAVDCTLEPGELDALDAASALPAEYPGWMLEFQPADRQRLID